jgi:cycloeucalenol cycloisomerase
MERFLLVYSVVWIGAVALVTLTRAFTRWGDLGHLALGVGLAAPLWIAPAVARQRGHAWRFNLWIGLFSLLQVYFGSALFFDVLGMEYHFPVTWILNRTPIFLYPMTIAYFSTYYVVMSLVWRRFRARYPCAPTVTRLAVLAALGYATAFAETFSMANPYLAEYFLYRNKTFALLVGSLCYGTVFVVSLPLVFRLDEPDRPSPARIVWDVLAVNMVVLVCYELYTHLLGRA